MSKYNPRDYPNVYRVAQELSRCKHPDNILSAMCSMLEGSGGIDNLTVGEVIGHEDQA